jgi:tetratricopeptide (TPR) repeat protein
VPTVALCGDWTVNAWATLPILEAFDVVLTDRAGVDALRRRGLTNVHHWRAYTFDPAIHRRLPGVARDIDLLFIGNPNVALYPDRERWLARAAALARRFRVVLATGVWGEGYTRLLNRARVVFNRTMRRELNQRAWEALAAGALLFIERDNLEVQDVFTDREHCVLYGDHDFEDLVAHYLARDDERTAVAEAGHERALALTHRHHVYDLVARLAELLPRISGPRAAGQRSEPDSRVRRGIKAIFVSSLEMGGGLAVWNLLANVNVPDLAVQSARIGTLASLLAMMAERQADVARRAESLERAGRLAQRAIDVAQADPLHRLRAGEIAARVGDTAGAIERFEEAARLATSDTPPNGAPNSVPFPFEYNRFRFFWDQAALEGPDAFHSTARRLMAARALHRLADLVSETELASSGVEFLRASVRLWPHLDRNSVVLAEALAQSGAIREAVEIYTSYLAEHPMDRTARERVGELLAVCGTPEERARHETETATIALALRAPPA